MLDLSKLNLQLYDFKLLVDKSGSMSTHDCPNGSTRWQQAHDWSKSIADICCRYDSDGIDVIVFDDDSKEYNNVNAAKVDEIFRKHSPGSSTNTAFAIKTALPEYFKTKLFGDPKSIVTRKKPVILIVFTDGAPDSKQDVEEAIIRISQRISDRKQVGITFLQVGNDAQARRFLEYLDDNLVSKGAKFDIVDTKNFSEAQNMSAEEIIYAAVTD